MNFPCSVAFGISAAAPEFLARVHALFCHAFYHRLAANWAGRGIGAEAFLGAGGKTLGGEAFRETALLLKLGKQMLYLAA